MNIRTQERTTNEEWQVDCNIPERLEKRVFVEAYCSVSIRYSISVVL